jgi:hypothetical protein
VLRCTVCFTCTVSLYYSLPTVSHAKFLHITHCVQFHLHSFFILLIAYSFTCTVSLFLLAAYSFTCTVSVYYSLPTVSHAQFLYFTHCLQFHMHSFFILLAAYSFTLFCRRSAQHAFPRHIRHTLFFLLIALSLQIRVFILVASSFLDT